MKSHCEEAANGHLKHRDVSSYSIDIFYIFIMFSPLNIPKVFTDVIQSKIFLWENWNGVNFTSESTYGLDRTDRGDCPCKLKNILRKTLNFQRVWNWGFQIILTSFKILEKPVTCGLHP